jgi:hypothetical protein
MTNNHPEFASLWYMRGISRDVPLTFGWRTEQNAIARLELPPAKSPRYEDARNAVLTEAMVAAKARRAVSYSRRKEHYVGHQRYYGESYSYNTILSAVADGVVGDLLEEERARPGSRGRQSRFWATSRLCRLLTASPESRCSEELIWLRDHSGRLIDYEDSALTRRMRREIEAINRRLSRIVVALDGVDVCQDGCGWIIAGNYYYPAPPHLRRIFSRGSFENGGRAYGWWQTLPSRYRSMMTINGERVLEPDFAQLHAQIIYALRGVALDGDAYETAEFSRDEGKMAFNIAINAKNRPSAIGAIMRHLKLGRHSATTLLQSITEKHKVVADVFCSDAGVAMMRIDGDVTVDVMQRCIAQGIAALPVHDSIMVPARHADQTAEMMVAAFAARFPEASPCKVRVKQSIPQMDLNNAENV